MAKQQHDRSPEAVTRGSGPDVTNGSGAASVLNIRLWAKTSDGTASVVSWPGTSPAACLIVDLIKASGGATESVHGTSLSARYPTAMLGVLMARRLQWALQGFTEATNDQATGAAILIESVQDSAGSSNAAMLSKAAPGQILLGSAISGDLGSLPGLAVRETTDPGWGEVLWRDSNPVISYPAEEQDLVRMIQKLGRLDPGPPKPRPQVPAAVSEAPIVKSPQAAAVAGSDDAILARAERESPLAENRRWLIMGGAAAAVVLVAVLLVVGLRHHSTVKAVTPANPSSSAGEQDKSSNGDPKAGNAESKLPQTDAKPPIIAVSPHPKVADIKERRPVDKPSKDDKQTGAKTVKADGGSCDLTEGEIPRSLERAKNDMHQGKLYEAQASFQRVLGCPSAHADAQAGLSEVRRKLEVQGLPLNQE